jgi:hypothetical protein
LLSELKLGLVATIFFTVPYDYYVIEEATIKDVRFLRSNVQRVWLGSGGQARHRGGSRRDGQELGTTAHCTQDGLGSKARNQWNLVLKMHKYTSIVLGMNI